MLSRKLTVAVLLCAVWPLVNVQAAGLDGVWSAEATYEGRVLQFELEFHVKGDTFTGEVRGSDWQDAMHDGRISGNRFSFRYGNNDVPAIVVTGTIDGDQLHITWDVTDTPKEERFSGTATRKK